MFQLFLGTGDRDHNLGKHLFLFFDQLSRGFKNGTNLHLGDLRISYAQTYAAVAHHRIGFMQCIGTAVEFLHGYFQAVCDLLAAIFVLRDKFM